MLSQARLYGILDLGYVTPDAAAGTVQAMLSGGVQLLQLRGKEQPREVLRAVALEIAPLLREAGVPLIINDDAQLAAELGADGVHLGQDDLPLAQARAMLGPDAILGKSTHSLAHAIAAENEGADYIGVGPIFATPTKPGRQPVGLELIAKINAAVSLPRFCIGGIKEENLPEVMAAGAERVVIVSGILQSADVAAYCRRVREQLAGDFNSTKIIT